MGKTRRLRNLRYRRDDPRRYHHQPARRRATDDPHDGTDDATPVLDVIDREAVRERGGVASGKDLQ